MTDSDSSSSTTSSYSFSYHLGNSANPPPPAPPPPPPPPPSAPAAPAKSNGKSRLFHCVGYEGCTMAFTRSEHLARHMRKHTGERPFACGFCSKHFSRLDNLRQHKLTVHAEEMARSDSGSGVRNNIYNGSVYAGDQAYPPNMAVAYYPSSASSPAVEYHPHHHPHLIMRHPWQPQPSQPQLLSNQFAYGNGNGNGNGNGGGGGGGGGGYYYPQQQSVQIMAQKGPLSAGLPQSPFALLFYPGMPQFQAYPPGMHVAPSPRTHSFPDSISGQGLPFNNAGLLSPAVDTFSSSSSPPPSVRDAGAGANAPLELYPPKTRRSAFKPKRRPKNLSLPARALADENRSPTSCSPFSLRPQTVNEDAVCDQRVYKPTSAFDGFKDSLMNDRMLIRSAPAHQTCFNSAQRSAVKEHVDKVLFGRDTDDVHSGSSTTNHTPTSASSHFDRLLRGGSTSTANSSMWSALNPRASIGLPLSPDFRELFSKASLSSGSHRNSILKGDGLPPVNSFFSRKSDAGPMISLPPLGSSPITEGRPFASLAATAKLPSIQSMFSSALKSDDEDPSARNTTSTCTIPNAATTNKNENNTLTPAGMNSTQVPPEPAAAYASASASEAPF